jgi:broad specificity phosphatase PhoE
MSQKDSSPVTGIIEESEVILDFGKYEGKSVEEIAKLDPDFYEKLATEKERGVFAIRRQRDKSFRMYVNPLTTMDH